MGLAHKLIELTGAPVMMHREEARQLAEAASTGLSHWSDDVLAAAGTPADLASSIEQSFAEFRSNIRALELKNGTVSFPHVRLRCRCFVKKGAPRNPGRFGPPSKRPRHSREEAQGPFHGLSRKAFYNLDEREP